jgi:uncharacterized membrane protein HdeD (DUF308 family)
LKPFWRLARRLAIYLACCAVVCIIEMISFPNYTDRIIPAFFGLAFVGIFFAGIFAAFWYLNVTEDEDKRAKAAGASGRKVPRPFKRFAAWTLCIVGAFFILRGAIAIVHLLSHQRVTPAIAGEIEDGILGGAAIYFGFRVMRVLNKSPQPKTSGDKSQ